MEDAMPAHRRTFPGDPRELRTARDWIHAALDGHPHSEDAALIVTELGTNALRHTVSGDHAGAFHIALIVSDLAITIAVTDSGRTKTAPEVQHPPLNATHGRGLAMVTALADSVTVHGDDSGRTVTAELRVQVNRRESTSCA
ncbi:ATP-binding protein [Streptomyces sp. V3I7]|uniref:ATP-binding protein n=1 Tax=Streptomyces sp. V3I7 TaxID=3042278 RepID=UPI00277E7770|nr:ATP-binding protein [Streptomyces sp. V3I7]MDQ0991641.1 anti-sigma regulatory factor (Ser/Thr protein kinase) [Streptomyces sp. V3I7]